MSLDQETRINTVLYRIEKAQASPPKSTNSLTSSLDLIHYTNSNL